MNLFAKRLSAIEKGSACRLNIKTLQVNMGDLCNQECRHCHIKASPRGKRIISEKTVDNCLKFLSYGRDLILDITGGAPEMNPHFVYFIQKARSLADEIVVRSNLTVLLEPERKNLPFFFKENKVHLICSMPCYTKENVDRQRGYGVYVKSVAALRILNSLGYGVEPDLKIDLVYNPGGAYLPAPQEILEKDYKRELKRKEGVVFNNLITITNAPINRFKEYLDNNNEYERYLGLLEDSFNAEVLENIMCRTLLSVGWDGAVYDCDFNQAKGMVLRDEKGEKINIKDIRPEDLTGREIMFDDHCFSCTAGAGSSCQGALDTSVKPYSGLHGAVKKRDSLSTLSNPRLLSRGSRKVDSTKVEKTRGIVKDYYGRMISTSKDLRTNACCGVNSAPLYVRNISSLIEKEIVDKFYGCGSSIPLELKGRRVLDLGCGTGRDTYIISYLVGEEGDVVGVDMTDEQLEIANKYLSIQMKKFGFIQPNIRFIKGYIENLDEIGLEDGSFDVVVSNCVINLSPRKDLILAEVYRVLKKGGEFFFSDVYADRRLPHWAKDDPVLVGECLGGALYWKDFERLAAEVGFIDCRVYSKKNIDIVDERIKAKIGFANFASITYRLFKMDGLEDACEDYGQIAVYRGDMEHSIYEFKLDINHIFFKGKPEPVCGNTALMLQNSRFGKYFEVKGDMQTHYGLFPGCGVRNLIQKSDTDSNSDGSSVCIC